MKTVIKRPSDFILVILLVLFILIGCVLLFNILTKLSLRELDHPDPTNNISAVLNPCDSVLSGRWLC